MSLVMGMDQHRAQISAEWLDTMTAEVFRARIAPADRAGVRKFLGRFAGEDLEVALEATTGWRFVVEELERVGAEVHLAEPTETSGLKSKKKRPRPTGPTRGTCASCCCWGGCRSRGFHPRTSSTCAAGCGCVIPSRTSGPSGSSGSRRCSITTASRSAEIC